MNSTHTTSAPKGAKATSGQVKERGALYWVPRNLWKHLRGWIDGVGKWIQARPIRNGSIYVAVVLGLMIFLVYARPFYSHLALDIRNYSGTMILIAVLLALSFALVRRMMRDRLRGFIPKILGIVVVFTALYWAGTIHEYLALHERHRTLRPTELSYMPLTRHERIQPLSSIETAAKDVMSDTESPTPVDFVRDPSGDYRMVMAVEPSYFFPRACLTLSVNEGSCGVNEVLSMPGMSPSVAFSRKYREKVSFTVGERLALDHNSYNCVVRTFGPWGIFNYEPSNVIYLKDDKGVWVQVVSLIRWTGIIFPRPEFGGVQLIRQGAIGKLDRLFFGCGEYISPEEVKKYSFLRGQSLVSPVVSRFIAESFRFQNGFFSPMPFYHYGDIRIPELPEDIAKQPFTAHFEFKDEPGGRLYQYFALEPFDENKRGLATSVFVPADGIGKVRVYNHAAKNESLVGVSAIGRIVMATRKEYDWEHNKPVEHRIYVRDVGGERRVYFLTAIVTVKENMDDDRFIAGAIPEIALTDPVNNTVVWVDATRPESWTRELEKRLVQVEGGR